MQTLDEYMAKTESAVRKLFEGIESYNKLLEPTRNSVVVSMQPDKAKLLAELDAWREQNVPTVKASEEARRTFRAENFAKCVLCGAVLQVASKAIEIYSNNTNVPERILQIVGNSSAQKYCVGRELLGLPIGLIVYAGRNQHTHYNDADLLPVNKRIFMHLAENYSQDPGMRSAFDITSRRGLSFADNITAILGWRSYEAYALDIRAMLSNG